MIPDRLFAAYRRQKLFDIAPYDPQHVQPVSYDVHLGAHAMMFSRAFAGYIIDLSAEEPPMDHLTVPPLDSPWKFIIHPGQFILGHTFEALMLSEFMAAEFMGKSTLGRVGLFVHVTAGLVDPGWGEQTDGGSPLTVELFNASPFAIRLWEGMPIGQLVLHMLPERVVRTYGSAELGSHYAGDTTVAGSRGFTHGRAQTVRETRADVSPGGTATATGT